MEESIIINPVMTGSHFSPNILSRTWYRREAQQMFVEWIGMGVGVGRDEKDYPLESNISLEVIDKHMHNCNRR